VDQARDVASYIALDKPSVAEKWIEDIFSSVDRLLDFPESGRIVPEIRRKEIREVVVGNYRVIYKLYESEVWILLVKNYRQKLTKEEVQP
jgi:plasmid stabilization system protein ParE